MNADIQSAIQVKQLNDIPPAEANKTASYILAVANQHEWKAITSKLTLMDDFKVLSTSHTILDTN